MERLSSVREDDRRAADVSGNLMDCSEPASLTSSTTLSTPARSSKPCISSPPADVATTSAISWPTWCTRPRASTSRCGTLIGYFTIGGGVWMNAGAYGSETTEVLDWADVFMDHRVVRMENRDLDLSYRHSALHENPGWISGNGAQERVGPE